MKTAPHTKPFIMLRMMIAFFMIVILVNIAFVTIALRTFRGVVDEHAYEHGLKYNDVLRAARERTQKQNAGHHE